MTIVELPPVIVLGRDTVGVVAESGGIRYYLTDCCAASAKGCEVTRCRACYQVIDYRLGGGAYAPDWPNGPLVEVYGDGLTVEQFKAQR